MLSLERSAHRSVLAHLPSLSPSSLPTSSFRSYRRSPILLLLLLADPQLLTNLSESIKF